MLVCIIPYHYPNASYEAPINNRVRGKVGCMQPYPCFCEEAIYMSPLIGKRIVRLLAHKK